MSLYPSLEDMKVDQMAQAQVIFSFRRKLLTKLYWYDFWNLQGSRRYFKAIDSRWSTVVGFLDVWKLHFDIYTNER